MVGGVVPTANPRCEGHNRAVFRVCYKYKYTHSTRIQLESRETDVRGIADCDIHDVSTIQSTAVMVFAAITHTSISLPRTLKPSKLQLYGPHALPLRDLAAETRMHVHSNN